MAKDINDPTGVSQLIRKFEPNIAEAVEAIRAIILNADTQIGEQIKWNSPSFFFMGEMPPFDPKEYRRDIVVLNLHKKDFALLVFPTGAKINDKSGLLEGKFADSRKVIKLRYDVQEIKSKGVALQEIIRDWINKINL